MSIKIFHLALAAGLMLSSASCAGQAGAAAPAVSAPVVELSSAGSAAQDVTAVTLGDSGVTVNGQPAPTTPDSPVYVGADIVYYEAGRDEAYGAGGEADGHTAEEAAAHTVVTIKKPGTYQLSGTLSAGQLAVDLGADAAEDPEAVVTLILDGVDITCTVAPAVIFYNVYECGSADVETAGPEVDTTAAGANVILAEGSENVINGSYVAKIYKEGTEEKLHKYDGAFYSRMSINVGGSGALAITAENEGLGSELHLTIYGGDISITAQNDGINTNEDGVSVTTVQGGNLYINAGLGAEGDGIDSNGYLVVNGGTVTAAANGRSGDGGIDSDMGVYLNGGTVIALGSRNDEAENTSAQPFMQLSFASTLPAGTELSVQDSTGAELMRYTAEKEFAALTFTAPALADGETYSVYVDGQLQKYTGAGFGMGDPGGGMRPDGRDEADGGMPADRLEPGGRQGQRPAPPEREGEAPPSGAPAGDFAGQGGRKSALSAVAPSTEFTLPADAHSFSGVCNAE